MVFSYILFTTIRDSFLGKILRIIEIHDIKPVVHGVIDEVTKKKKPISGQYLRITWN